MTQGYNVRANSGDQRYDIGNKRETGGQRYTRYCRRAKCGGTTGCGGFFYYICGMRHVIHYEREMRCVLLQRLRMLGAILE